MTVKFLSAISLARLGWIIGVVIAFGIAVSTILGRFVIPIYYVLGERLIDHFGRRRAKEEDGHPEPVDHRENGHANGHHHHPRAPSLAVAGAHYGADSSEEASSKGGHGLA